MDEGWCKGYCWVRVRARVRVEIGLRSGIGGLYWVRR